MPGSRRFAYRVATISVIVSVTVALLGFSLLARAFPTVQLFKQAEKDLVPEMHFGNVDYAEPSVVWYFRSRVNGFFWGVNPGDVQKFMEYWGPKFIILPTDLAKTAYPELPPGWKSYSTKGFVFAKGKRANLTMILKPTP